MSFVDSKKPSLTDGVHISTKAVELGFKKVGF